MSELNSPLPSFETKADWDEIEARAVSEIRTFGSGTTLAYAVLRLLYDAAYERASSAEMEEHYGSPYRRPDAWLAPIHNTRDD